MYLEVSQEGAQENATKQISEGVTLKAQRGGFGCPASRADVGFPEPYVSDNELVSMIKECKKVKTVRSKGRIVK